MHVLDADKEVEAVDAREDWPGPQRICSHPNLFAWEMSDPVHALIHDLVKDASAGDKFSVKGGSFEYGRWYGKQADVCACRL